MKSHVRVGIRVRPLNSKENIPVLTASGNSLEITGRRFTYDHVFDADVSQEELFPQVNNGMLASFIEGYNATIMAYGQTGSGKTFTMGSSAHSGLSESTGLIPRFMKELFDNLPENSKVEASFLEVYGEDIHDLLHPDRPSLTLREDADGSVVCSGLTSQQICSADQCLQVLHEGTLNRTTAATLMNLTSSRSHAVFTVVLTQPTMKSKLTFVDLAGSERMKKTGASGERAKEGIDINKGLLALGNVINALSERLSHVPYRQSKLTRLLQEALGGNSQTLFLACVSPADTNANETLSTLHYANRARHIENAVAKNIDPESAEVRKWKCFADILQRELLAVKFDTNSSKSDIEAYFDSLKARAMENDDTSIELGRPLKDPPVTVVRGSSPPPSDVQNLSVLESFDPTMLDGVNPDEEMAILDQLLNIQQRDQEYDDEQKEDDLRLKQFDGELEEKESLLLQLRESLKVYHNMKDQYENLMAEVQQLESEKSQLAQQLEKAQKDPKHGCSHSITRKLKKVEDNLKRAREEARTHRDQHKKAERQAKQCEAMQKQISDLKQGRTQLMKKQREASARHRSWTEETTRKILALQRKERSQSKQVSKLQNQIDIHKRNLNKRQEYCQKLLSQKQTAEKHLMQLIKTRQRKFKTKPQKSPDITAFDAKVKDVIDAAATQKEYDEQVAKYSQAMRNLVEAVKSDKDDSTLAELQVQVDIASAAIESSRRKLKEPPALSAPALVQHTVDWLVETELKRQEVSQHLDLKKSVVMTLEMEVETLNSNMSVLKSQILRNRNKDTEESSNEEVVQENQLLHLFANDLNHDYQELSTDLAVTREKLTLSEKLADINDGGGEVPALILQELQSLWDELRVPLSDRAVSRSKLENCVEEICKQELQKARQLKESILTEISDLKAAIVNMARNLSIEPPGTQYTNAKIIDELMYLRDVKSDIEGRHEAALETKSAIVTAVSSLIASGQKETLDSVLLDIIDEKNVDLSQDFLEKCNTALVALQAKKSRLLAKSGSSRSSTYELLAEMNYEDDTKILSMVVHDMKRRRGSLPEWWNTGMAKIVAKAVTTQGGVVHASESFSQHVSCFRESISHIAEGRRLLSQKLQQLVERAQTTLLKTVDGELGANEAYSSFHEALFRLPALSKERIHACIAEIDALSTAVDDLSQSEVEALTVVWEALNITPQEQSKFWGVVDESQKLIQTTPGGPFDDILSLSMVEEWVLSAVKEATRSFRALEFRLVRLERIHEEVEMLRTRQDAKSRIISLDSEVRLLSAKLNEFEDKKCSKQRLTTKKTTSSNLLKEERFRKQMQTKFTAKLSQLDNMLKTWKSSERASFDQNLLSNEVRSQLKSGDRHEFMHLRTVEYRGSKRDADNIQPSLPPAKRPNRTTSKNRQVAPTSLSEKPSKTVFSPMNSQAKKRTPLSISRNSTTKKRLTLDPFGAVLNEAFTSRNKENSTDRE